MKSYKNHMAIVKQVLWSLSLKEERARNLLSRVEQSEAHFFSLESSDVDYICFCLVRELTETGLGPDSEPNLHGMQVEEAIDWIRGIRLHT